MAAAEGKLPSAFAATADKKVAEKSARVIVAGTGGVARDEFLSQSTATLLLNIVDWMLLDPALLEMRSRGMAEAPIDPELTDSTRAWTKNLLVAAGPALLFVYGFIRRRIRSGRKKTLMAMHS